MKINYLLRVLAALCVLGGTAACGGSTETKTATANQPVAQTATTNSSQPETPKVVPEQPAAGSLASPTEAYKTAYAARQRKDLAGLKAMMSKRLLGFLTSMGEAEKKTVDDELQQLVDTPQALTAEARNEKINGDTATLEYLGAKGTWAKMDFVKEGNDWKLTLPAAQVQQLEDTTKKHK